MLDLGALVNVGKFDVALVVQGELFEVSFTLRRLSALEVVTYQAQLGRLLSMRASSALAQANVINGHIEKLQSLLMPVDRDDPVRAQIRAHLAKTQQGWDKLSEEQQDEVIDAEQQPANIKQKLMMLELEKSNALASLALEAMPTAEEVQAMIGFASAWVTAVHGVQVSGESLQWSKASADERARILELLTHHQLSSLLAHAVKLSALSEVQKKT